MKQSNHQSPITSRAGSQDSGPADHESRITRHWSPITTSHLINGQPSKLVNSDLHNFDSGTESAGALQPRATPWVSESIGPPCKGGGILRPCRAEHGLEYVPGALPRLACSAPLARHRGRILERSKLLRNDL